MRRNPSPIAQWPEGSASNPALLSAIICAGLWREGLNTAPLARFCAIYAGKANNEQSFRAIGTHAARLDRVIRQSAIADEADIAGPEVSEPKISGADLLRTVTALALREGERGRIVAGQSEFFTELFAQNAITALPLRSRELAQSCFAYPDDRHCHATHWWIADAGQFAAACTLARKAGWIEQPASVLSPHRRVFQKSGGAQLDLHRRPFAWAVPGGGLEWSDPHFRLVELTASLVAERSIRMGRWIFDCAEIIRGHRLDPGTLAGLAQRCGIAGSLHSVLAVTKRHAPADDAALHERLSALGEALGGALNGAEDGDEACRNARLLSLARGPRPGLLRHFVSAPSEVKDALHLRREFAARRKDVRAVLGRLDRRSS